MNNYQLYKTSTLLGGQMKLDIIINTNDGETYIDDFHMTPISKTVPYNRHSERNLLSYPHQNNISDFYKKIISSFYESYIPPQLNHNWPIIDDSKIYDDTFFSGCSRMDYNIYDKQFEYFCPLWLEQIGEGNHLVFDISVKTIGGCNPVAKKSISFRYKNIKNHDKFITYLNNYFKYIGIDKGCDDIMNINFFKTSAYLRGIDLNSGNLVVRNLIDLPYNLMIRERPLLEYDYMITSSYKDTKTIVPNLFNFNICFNIDDIFTSNVIHLLYGHPVILNIQARIANAKDETVEILEKRDLYTNYDYIPKKKCEPIFDIHTNIVDNPIYDYIGDHPNVFDYNKDNKFISNIDKNKISQNIMHWQLNDNDSYIFNLYEGFRGYLDEKIGVVVGDTYFTEQPVSGDIWLISDGVGVVEKDTLILNEGIKMSECYNRYADTPDILQTRYSRSLNNVGWAHCVYLDKSNYLFLKSDNELIHKLLTKLSPKWNGYLYYDIENISSNILLGYCNDKNEFKILKESITEEIIDLDENTFITTLSDSTDTGLLIISNNINNLTFASVKKYLKNNMQVTHNPNNLVKNLYNMMNSVKPLPVVAVNNRLGLLYADSPNPFSKEVDYKKVNTNMIYMLRYDGKIKPNMIPIDAGFKNYIYNKVKLSDMENLEDFKKYTESGYSPLYPSIGYWAYDKQYINYKTPPNYVDYKEYKWFENSKMIYTKPEVNLKVSSNDNTMNSINKAIKLELKNITEVTDDIIIDYIFSLYHIYYNLTDNIGGKYNYEINMCFK